MTLRLKIVDLYRAGNTQKRIIRTCANDGYIVSRHTVKYWIDAYNRGYFVQLNSDNRPINSQKLVTDRDIEVIRETLTNDPNISSRDVQSALINDGSRISSRTVRRAINEAGFVCSKPRYAQLVRDVNKEKRQGFCQDLISRDDSFDDVIFSDESSIQLHGNKLTSYRECNSVNKCLPKPKHPFKVHVWGAISRRGKSALTIFEGIMDSNFFVN
jgi:transposase